MGAYTTKGYFYKPAYGASGETEMGYFHTALDVVDSQMPVFPQAYGTGTGTVGDPWTGLAAAYTACPAGGTIYLRAGYYALSARLNIAKSINIIGEGIGKTFIVTGAIATNAIYMEGQDYITLQGFTIDGNAQTGGDELILITTGCTHIIVKDVETKNAYKSGIELYESDYCTFQNIWAHDNGDVGLYSISNKTGSNTHNFYQNIYCYDNDDHGFKTRVGEGEVPTAQTYNIFDNIQAWGNGSNGESGIGIYFQKGIILSNSKSFLNEHNGIFLEGIEDSIVYNCLTSTNGGTGLRIQYSDNLTLINLVSRNNNLQDDSSYGIYLYGSTNTKFNSCQSTDDRVLSGVDIAFHDNGAGQDTITMTSAQFLNAGFMAGKSITITGSTSNNVTKTIISVTAGTIYLATGSLVEEEAGDTVVITHAKVQPWGLGTSSTTQNIELVACDLSGNLTANIRNLSAATITVVKGVVDGDTPVAGDIQYHNGTNWVRLAKGTANQYLKMNGTATAPIWVT